MSVRESGGQSPTWDPGPLTLSPGRVEVDQSELGGNDTERARRSSRAGTADQYCHIFVGAAPYRYTSCGQRLKSPLPIKRTHAEPPCPNGNPPCPECVRVRQEDERLFGEAD